MPGTPDLFGGAVEVMLTKAQESIPRPAAAGQLAYEMKWDGYRAALQVTPDGVVRLWSRNGTDLSRAFPDLIEAARVQVPPGIVLDGEAVAWVEGRLSFDHFGGGKVTITHVSPVVVVEVSADAATQGGRHRHALRLIRLRSDLAPNDITTD